MEDTDQVVFYEPRLLLVEVGEGRFSTVLQHGDGTVERLPVTCLLYTSDAADD